MNIKVVLVCCIVFLSAALNLHHQRSISLQHLQSISNADTTKHLVIPAAPLESSSSATSTTPTTQPAANTTAPAAISARPASIAPLGSSQKVVTYDQILSGLFHNPNSTGRTMMVARCYLSHQNTEILPSNKTTKITFFKGKATIKACNTYECPYKYNQDKSFGLTGDCKAVTSNSCANSDDQKYIAGIKKASSLSVVSNLAFFYANKNQTGLSIQLEDQYTP